MWEKSERESQRQKRKERERFWIIVGSAIEVKVEDGDGRKLRI